MQEHCMSQNVSLLNLATSFFGQIRADRCWTLSS